MADAFDALLDRLADQLADRVMARLEARLATPGAAQPDAYRLDEAAHKLGLSRTEVRRRIKAGELRSVHVGRAVLVPSSAVRDFLDGPGNSAISSAVEGVNHGSRVGPRVTV